MKLPALLVLRTLSSVCLLCGTTGLISAADDIILGDFEGADYGTWTVSGTAFGTGPAHGTLANQQPVSGFIGKGLVNSYAGGDDSQGELESATFAIERPFLDFLVGGGNRPGEAYVALVVDGAVVRAATGGDNEALSWKNWDVGDLHGKQAHIRIVDHATGGWGHINADEFRLSDQKQGPTQTDLTVGQDLVISVAEPYNETYRPQFHFTARTNWLNDPNGLVFYSGRYHLFFQHNPSGIDWGNMTWGHAISSDLLHWQQQADAIEPDKLGTIFSGSAAVDWNNTSGFQSGALKPLVAMYTAAGDPFTQCLAYSNDNGQTWTKYPGNPVLKNQVKENRDPKIVWYEPKKEWILALFLDNSTYALFASPNLKEWTKLQSIPFPGYGECPDFFPIQLVDKPAVRKWVLTSAAGSYMTGDFDGSAFTSDGVINRVDFGPNYYAVQTYSDIPAADGRRIQIAWMNGGHYPKMPFNQQMSVPCVLSLHETPQGLRLFRSPVRELDALRFDPLQWHDKDLAPGSDLLAGLKADTLDIRCELEPRDAKQITVTLRGIQVSYDVAQQTLQVSGSTAPVALINGRLSLRILLDRTSIEAFANEGRASISTCFIARPQETGLALTSSGGTARVISLQIDRMRSAWQK